MGAEAEGHVVVRACARCRSGTGRRTRPRRGWPTGRAAAASVALVDLLAAELDVAGGGAGHVLDRATPSAASPRPPAGSSVRVGAAAASHWSRCGEQLVDAAGDDVAGGLVAADEDEQRLVDDLVVGRAGRRRPRRGTRMLMRSSCGLGPAGRDDRGRRSRCTRRRRRRPSCACSSVASPVERLEHVVGPAQQVGAVLGRDAEHVADHDHRQRGGDVADEVALAPLAHARR